MNLDFKKILNLASTKWNFLKFDAGLVGGLFTSRSVLFKFYCKKK